EAMTSRDVAGADAVDLEINDDRLFRFRAEGAENRLKRTDPAQRAGLGGRCAPAHRLRPRKISDDARHHLGDDLLGRPTRPLDDCDVEITPLRVGTHLGLLYGGKAGRAEEPFHRLGGRVSAWALALFAHVARAGDHPPHVE